MKNSMKISPPKPSPDETDGHFIGDFVANRSDLLINGLDAAMRFMIINLHGDGTFDGILISSNPWNCTSEILIYETIYLRDFVRIVGEIKISQEK